MTSATIKLHLPRGDAKSPRTAEISNWTGKAVAAPRTELDELLAREEPDDFRPCYSMTVVKTMAKDGGTPVILDDALGYTGQERLKLMGAVLAVAARECQIVIFTCVPERYAFIGEAVVVPL